MDDLNGLSWTSSPNDNCKPPPMNSSSLFPSVRRNDVSGRTTPVSASSGPSNPPSKPATPSGDSFANLVSFGSSNLNKNLPLVEQQKRLQEERGRKEAENRARYESQYGGQNSQFWDSLEKGGDKPLGSSAAPSRQDALSLDEDDLLAAFNASAPVDASTHFPVPSPSPSPQVLTSGPQSTANGPTPLQQSNDMSFIDDDDPFGLDQLKPKSQPAPQPSQTDDDDFLGLLGKPVSELPRPEHPRQSSRAASQDRRASPKPPRPANGVDRAIAELVDMGFPADKASQALGMTSSGTDVQAAVGLLLTQAHEDSRQKSQNRSTNSDLRLNQSDRSKDRSQRRDRNMPSWMQPEHSGSGSDRRDARSPSSMDKDPAQVAAAFGNNLLKSANSFWKTSSKRVQQVVNEFNADNDQTQPRWMKEPTARGTSPGERPLSQPRRDDFTDEALLLEGGGPQRPSRKPTRTDDVPTRTESDPRRREAPMGQTRMQQPAFMRQQPTPELRDSRSRASMLAVEQQSAQVYVSPARRKRPVAPPSPQPVQNKGVDLFDSSAPTPAARPPAPAAPAAPARPPRASPSTLPTRPKAPPRVVPQVARDTLTSIHAQREKAVAAYKRGDYGVAHEAFTAALTGLPEKHPIVIVIRSNRAMTALKVGEPKVAINDADLILELIGPSKGETEKIDLCNGEPHKPMKDFYGKGLMRKAEALEQLEKWAEAAQVWKLAVENGHGGSTSIQGRNRCEKAAGIGKPVPKPSAPARRPPPAPKKPVSALDDFQATPASTSGTSFEAVTRLRAANQAAERNDEEKFALTDSVDARLAAWKNGKQDNLRALLGSLDTVLWPESGWKKANMSELIMPSKVKIQYMKGIAKVHPDKISTNATTEQRMIAGAVFGVLNEAWDKFKAENNL